jgi:hypothetical protein
MTDPVREFIYLAEHNLKLFDLLTGQLPKHIKDEDFSDWQVTIIFYMACILVKALCATLNEDPRSHLDIRQLIHNKNEFQSFAKEYRKLEEASRQARYEGRTFLKSYIEERLVLNFNVIKQNIGSALKKKNKTIILPNLDLLSLLNRK